MFVIIGFALMIYGISYVKKNPILGVIICGVGIGILNVIAG